MLWLGTTQIKLNWITATKTTCLFYVCINRLMYHFEWMWICLCKHVLYTNVLHMWRYKRCTCWRSDMSVLCWWIAKKKTQYVVFIGTMININDLSSLSYSPFILFSSLPFDIPVCFHSQNTPYYVQKAIEKYKSSPRKQALYTNKLKLELHH